MQMQMFDIWSLHKEAEATAGPLMARGELANAWRGEVRLQWQACKLLNDLAEKKLAQLQLDQIHLCQYIEPIHHYTKERAGEKATNS